MQPAESPGGRDHALDALRTLAILGMMAAHTARLVPFDARPGWLRAVLLYEPVIPTLFLLLVGMSLAASRAAAAVRGVAASDWYRRQLRRAAVLWLISALFFMLELGPRLPDALLAGGILANIAYAILLVGALLALPPRRARAALALAALAGTATFVWLDARGLRLHPVNIGNSPFLPLWLFAIVGALWGTLATNDRDDGGSPPVPPSRPVLSAGTLQTAVGLLLAALAIGLIAHFGAGELFTKPLGRSDAGRLVPASLLGADAVHVGYYNLRPLLALCCLGLQLGALVLLRKTLARLPERAAAITFTLGRRALEVYVLHLALLAMLVVTRGRHPLTEGWQGTATWVFLVVACMIYGLLRNKHVGKRRQPL